MVEEITPLILKKKEEPKPLLGFRKGQVVCLNSDEVPMTIGRVMKNLVTVCWHDDAGAWNEVEVEAEMLRLPPVHLEIELED